MGIRVGVPGWGIGVWVLGRAIPVPSHTARGEVNVQRSGPRTPCRGGSGWYIELGRARASGTTLALPGPAPCGRCTSTPPHGQIAASWPIRRDLTSNILKLVKTAECRSNMSKRPVIVPIFKMGPESHLLKFSDFHILQPSLTRN